MSQFMRSSVPHSAFARSGLLCPRLELFHQNAHTVPSGRASGFAGGISQSLNLFADNISGATFSPAPAPPHAATASVVTGVSEPAPSTGAKNRGVSTVTRTLTRPAGESQLGKYRG